ncbi:uncharacterized protein LOC114287975 [Camellia sinensis]|uniref:uncharacterized protein LOC114287975 n=1 Tax=Camellia sinensis TaxID=4442 RepID=UPI001035A990|nr:uncharacterized protein LOC114287975 [Camellia sinensis]
MDKSWIALGSTVDGRISLAYYDRVISFLRFAMAVIDRDGKILCPCRKCVNVVRHNFQIVQIHLLQHGIISTYTIWHVHGEPRESNEAHHHDIPVKGNEVLGGIDALVEDRIRGQSTNTTQEEEVRTFDKLLNDAKREVYPGCTNYTLLQFVIEILNMKVTNHWSNKSVDMMLEFLTKLLPKDNLVPKSTYEAKKILRELGLSYELIDACVNDCVLFWKANATLDKCPNCNASRYKTNHGRDSDEWKEFDSQHPEFTLEPRNVRLGLATDGFNPFGNMNNSYSLWHIVLIPYNLPPWLAMNDPFFMLSLLIPGESQPGIDIDVYMRPLVDELNELWKNGTLTYDASTGETFCMRAALMWTIHDWPAFGDMSGWRTKGHYSCYTCNDEPRKSRAYNGEHEKWKRSLVIPIEKIEEQLASVTGVTYGKHPSNRKRPRQNPNWTKVSILYELPYWKKKRLRHNIDVMHVEKNFSENVVGTMLGIDGKNKDTDKARMDLEDMNIRKELWLTKNPDGSTLKRSEMEKLEEHMVLILCKFEKIFPPAFFDVMVHLAIHLPRETILGGPVQYRWMYPIERILEALKKFVNNRARPKGSIAEAYIVRECITFFSMYLERIETVQNRDARNEDYGVRRQGLTICTETARPIGQIRNHVEMSQELRDIAHWFLLYNSPEIEKYLQEHKNLLQISTGQDITQIQQKEFPKWFKEYINRLRVDEAPEATEELWSLANGPNFLVKKVDEAPEATEELWSLANGPNLLVKEYSGCIINGVRFHTKELDNRRKSQNSAVLTKGDYKGEMHEFYGHLCNIWEFEYMCQNKVVLFQCEWYNTGNTGRSRTVRADTYCTSIDVTSRWYQSDPFILPSQAKLVFYLNDTKWGQPWQVVQQVQHRGVFDVPEVGNGEPPDQPEFNDAFQQEYINSVVPIKIEDIIRCHRDDIEAEVIPNKTKRDGRDDEEDEELGILDDDMDPDMELDMDYDI